MNGYPPYSYLWSTGATTQTINNLPAGYYSVTVTDNQGYTASANTTLNEPPPISAYITTTCGIPGSMTVYPSGGVPGYTYLWSNGASSQTIINLPPGQYCVTVTDANSCAIVKCANTGTGPSVTVTTTNAGCNGSGGSATANPAGGTPPYSYSWSNGGNTQTINNLPAGNYSVTVTDNNGCTGTGSGTVNISNNGFPIWLTTTPPSSCSSNNGSITATPMGGLSPYTYLWSNGGTTQTITGLGTGTYTVTVTDATGCTATKSATLTAPSNVSAWASSTDETCAGANDGTASASGMGGTQPYTYIWSNGQTGSLITGLSPGSYTVTVTDFFGCSGSATVYVAAGSTFALTINAQNVTTCGGSNGSATAVTSGGTPPFSYSWNTGATTQTITNLPAGFYSVTVTDINGCQKASSVWITEPPNLSVFVQATGTVCPNQNNGMASAFVNGGTAPFFYSWSNGGNTQTISNLGAGNYYVTVTDINGCQGTASATINASDLIIDVIKTNVSCYGGNDGAIEVTGWNGTPPYFYQWNNGSNSNVLTNLPAGNYTVTVTDSDGCAVWETITITEPPMIVINFNATQPGCTGGTGSATAIVSGGTPGYTYQWSNGGTGPTITNLSSGTYFVTVTDAMDCKEVGAVTIAAPPPLNVAVNGNDVTCYGANDGSASAMVFGGTPPFSFSWNNGASTQSIFNLTAGLYGVTVTDSQGCTGSGSVWINEPSNISVNITATPILCPGNNAGMASAFANGGTAPYIYQWNTGATTQTIFGLTAGTYSVTVTDAQNCAAIASATIQASDFIIDVAKQDVFCFGEATGSILVSGWNGTPPYTYQWNTGSISPDIMNLPAGNYTVTVTDAAGCVLVETITINQPPNLNLNAVSQNAGCTGTDGTAMAIVSGGTPPYSYSWSNGANTANIFNLTPGTYMVQVQDANFCTKTASVTISGASFSVNVFSNNVTCYGGNDGLAMANVSGGIPPYSYSWSNGGTGNSIFNLTAGLYVVTATDSQGCTATESVWITEPGNFTASVTTTPADCGVSNGSAAAFVTSGGVGNLTYSWSNGGFGAVIMGLSPGTYTVTLTDSNGCKAIASGNVGGGPGVFVNVNINNVTCHGFNDGAATANASGGTAPFIYNWSNGSNNQTISNLDGGQYSVTVTDINGCTDVETVWISEPAPITLNLSVTDPSCGNNNDGKITAFPSGGMGNFSYNWSNGATTQTVINLSAGTYSVTVTDDNGCTKSGSATLTAPSSINVTAITISSSCVGANNGSASADATGGTPPYTFNWSNGATGGTVFNLAPGSYTVTATDATGCSAFTNVFIPTAASPTCNAWVIQQPTSASSNDGVAQANASGGAPPYTYFWSDGQTTPVASGLDEGTYSVTVTDFNGCTAVCSVTLEAPPGVCDNVTYPGEICCNQTLCGPGNDPAPITEIVPPSGGSGALEFLWMWTVDPGPFNPTVWNAIPNSNSPSYDPGPLYETTYFIRCVRRENCVDYYESNIITITIGAVAIADIDGPTLVCVGDPATYTTISSGPGATYSWDFGPGAIPQTASTQTATTMWNSWGVKTIALTVTKNNCTSTDTMNVTVSNNPAICGSALVINANPVNQQQVLVEWTTDNHMIYDSIRFIIERSPDNVEFEDIGEKPGLPSNGILTHYEFFDNQPKKARSFYRVRMEDQDGNYTHSNTVEVMLTGGISLAHIYPNPFNDVFFVEILEDYGNDVSLEIYTPNGILLETIDLPDDAYRSEVDLSAYSRGMYILVVMFDNERQKVVRVSKM